MNYTILIRTVSVLLLALVLLITVSVWPEPSPETLMERHDNQRVKDLGLIIEAIHEFRRANERLPYSLQELSETRPTLKWQDQVNQRPYDYTQISSTVYSLCALFQTESNEGSFGSLPGFSRHGVGQNCVYRTFDEH